MLDILLKAFQLAALIAVVARFDSYKTDGFVLLFIFPLLGLVPGICVLFFSILDRTSSASFYVININRAFKVFIFYICGYALKI